MNTYSEHPDYIELKGVYRAILDCRRPNGLKKADYAAAGGAGIYLPNPFYPEVDKEIKAAYLRYVMRAVHHQFTQHTVSASVGLAMSGGIEFDDSKAPVLEHMSKNIDGRGVSLSGQISAAIDDGISLAGGGLLVHYPSEGEATKAQQDSGEVRSVILRFNRDEIKDWSHDEDGSEFRLNYVRCERREVYRTQNGGQTTGVKVYSMYLDDDGYRLEIKRKSAKDTLEVYRPTIAKQALGYIPFFPYGSKNNDIDPDNPPVWAVTELELGHYRNSADQEDSIFKMQPQYWTDDESIGREENRNNLRLGSGMLFGVQTGTKLGLEQPNPNTMASEGMEAKEKAIVSFGGRLVGVNVSMKTATQAWISNITENSVLQTVMNNVESAYEDAFAVISQLENIADIEPPTITTDLTSALADPNMLRLLMDAWSQGLVSDVAVRDFARKVRVIEKDEKEIVGELDAAGPEFNVSDDEGEADE